MPAQSSSTSTNGAVRLAHVFVRIPSENPPSDEPTTNATAQEMKMGSNETPAHDSHSLQPSPSASNEQHASTKEPLTPQKPAKTTHVNSNPHFPPTPSPTPTKNALKRPFAHDPQTPPPKRHSITNNTTNSPPRSPSPSPSPLPSTQRQRQRSHSHFQRTPKFSLAYKYQSPSSASPSPLALASATTTTTTKTKSAHKSKEKGKEKQQSAISWQELKRAAESIMRQVDWAEVAQDVAGNRGGGVYKRAVRGVLQKGVEELVCGEEE